MRGGVPDARRPAAYPKAYREQIIALARAGRILKALAQEFELSEQAIRNCIFQAEADRGERPGALTSDGKMLLGRFAEAKAPSRGSLHANARVWV